MMPHDQKECGLVLNVVVIECSLILKLAATVQNALMVRRDPFFVFDARLQRRNRIELLHIQYHALARNHLNENFKARVAWDRFDNMQHFAVRKL